jgi:eukaryotic-like serine/threonine-protein kinase
VQAYERWQQTYPKDFVPYGNLGFIYSKLGNQEKLLEESREAIRLELSNWLTYLNLASAYQNLNRLDEAEVVYKQAEERNLGGGNLLGDRYALAFVRGDTAQLSLLATAVTGKPGMEDFLLAIQGDAEAWYGKL